jgi:GH18 family chitinase
VMKVPAVFTALGLAAAKWSPGSIDASDKPLIVLYYDEWSKWQQFFSVYQMERMILSRNMPVRNWVVNYSFLTFSPQTCRLVPTDNEVAWSSPETQMFPGSAWWDQGAQYGKPAGGMPAMLALRQKYPYVKFMFSVGGWSMSHTFSDCIRSAQENMIESCKDFVYYFDFDGIDLDWEYPECPLDGASPDTKKQMGKCGCQGEPTCYNPSKNYYSPNKAQEGDWEYYKDFIKNLRAGLDDLEDKMQKKLYVTAAIGMNPKHINGDGETWKAPLPVEWICDEDHFDWVNLMTYDFYGPWAAKTGHLSPLYKSTAQDADEIQISIDESIQMILARCSRPEKLTMGLAAYGKGWSNVPNSGTIPGFWQTSENKHTDVITANMTYGPKMSFEQGTISFWDLKYNYLTNSNCKRTYDDESKAPTLYCTRINEAQYAGQDDLADNVFITYDDGQSWGDKMAYARKYGMAGAIIWAASGSGHEAFTTHDGRNTDTHDGVPDLYNGLFKGWYGSENPIGSIGANGKYTFTGIEWSDLPNGSTCPYGKGSWRNQEVVTNSCYDGGQLFDYQNTKYPQKTGSGSQDSLGKDVILISASSSTTSTTSSSTTSSTSSTSTTPPVNPDCTLPPKCSGHETPAPTPEPSTASTSTTITNGGSGGLEECQSFPFGGDYPSYCISQCSVYYLDPEHCTSSTMTTLECLLDQMPFCAA